MVIVQVGQSVLALGIIGPIQPQISLIRTAMLSTINANSHQHFSDTWNLSQHRHKTLALSYRYGRNHERDAIRLTERDAENAAQLILKHCHQQALNTVFIWCDNAYSLQRERAQLDWAAGGVAPYATFKVISVVSLREPRFADSYWRLWIWIETFLGACGSGVVMAPSSRNESHSLDNLFSEFQKSRKRPQDGLAVSNDYLLVGLAAALTQNMLDTNPVSYEKDLADMKAWAKVARDQDLQRHLTIRLRPDVSTVISLIGGAPYDPVYKDEPCWDLRRDFEIAPPPQLRDCIENGMAIICSIYTYVYVVCIPLDFAPGVPSTSPLSVSVDNFKPKHKLGEATWRRRMVATWQLQAVREVKQCVRAGDWQSIRMSLTKLDPRYERMGDERISRTCELIDICKIRELNISG